MPPYGPGSGTPTSGAPTLPGEMQDPGRSASPTAPLAVGALVICVAAFLLGWVPLLGAALGLVGIVLVVLAARRGLATKRLYTGAAAAALGVLASVAVTVALVGTVILPGSGAGPDPVAAAGESEELEEGTDETATPVAEEETTTADEQPATTEAETTPAPEPESEPTEESELTEEPAPAPSVAPDRSTYEELDERELAQIVKAPDDHIGRQVVVHGQITQLDAATGKCFVRVSISHTPQDDWYEYEHNSVGFAGDGESDCPVLDPFVADDEVTLWVTIGGSLSYDTQIGGSTTVPAYLIDDAELIGE